jgi:large subunit ribosomal protein L30
MIAAVQLRGSIGARHDVRAALKSLSLDKKHNCVLVEDRPEIRGMLLKAKDFIAFGPVSAPTADKIKALSNGRHARLHPPRGGLKSIKRAYGDGGDLGDRGEAMDDLVKRMLP